MSKRKNRFFLLLSDRERKNLELVSAIHEVSLSQAIRTILRSGFIKLGIEKDIEDDVFLKK
jgi:hypothetical protein